jgi:hypothetical protein
MFEKIGDLAERLASNVGTSRRGFLARVGQAALGAAGALGGLLALPGAAQARPQHGYCAVGRRLDGGTVYSGYCVSRRDCAAGRSSDCTGYPVGASPLCGWTVGRKHCRF